jgi:flavin-binding protein dodecin
VRLPFRLVAVQEEYDHGRKRLQDHRDRRNQPHVLGEAASAAVERASSTLRDLRVAEVCEQDVTISDGKVEAYRVRLKVSFKFED